MFCNSRNIKHFFAVCIIMGEPDINKHSVMNCRVFYTKCSKYCCAQGQDTYAICGKFLRESITEKGHEAKYACLCMSGCGGVGVYLKKDS